MISLVLAWRIGPKTIKKIVIFLAPKRQSEMNLFEIIDPLNRTTTSLTIENRPINLIELTAHIKDTNITSLILKSCSISHLPNDFLMFVVKLDSLNLDYNHISNQGCLELSHILNKSNLTSVSLRRNGISHIGLNHLIKKLYSNFKLKELYLSQNSIKDVGVYLLSKLLAQNNTLQSLHISYNQIGLTGAMILERMLRDSKLLKFSAMNNPIGFEGLTAIMSGLVDNQILEELIIGNSHPYHQFLIERTLDEVEINSLISNKPVEIEESEESKNAFSEDDDSNYEDISEEENEENDENLIEAETAENIIRINDIYKHYFSTLPFLRSIVVFGLSSFKFGEELLRNKCLVGFTSVDPLRPNTIKNDMESQSMLLKNNYITTFGFPFKNIQIEEFESKNHVFKDKHTELCNLLYSVSRKLFLFRGTESSRDVLPVDLHELVLDQLLGDFGNEEHLLLKKYFMNRSLIGSIPASTKFCFTRVIRQCLVLEKAGRLQFL
jgi:hypothetical protein